MEDEPNDKPAEDGDQPVDEADKPTEDGDQPAAEADKPAEGGDQPAAEADRPAEDGDQPADEADKPAEDRDQPAEDGDKSVDEADKPADDQPAQKSDDKPAATGSDDEFRKRCMSLLTKHEGRMKHVYLDTLKLSSIGIGFNLKRGGAREVLAAVGADYDQVVAGKQDLTDEQIDALFNRDLDTALAAARRQVLNFADLAFNARLVIVDMAFMGEAGLAGFKKMIGALKKLDYNTAADEMKDSQWYVQVGLRGPEDEALMRSAASG